MGEQRVILAALFDSLFVRGLKGRITPELKERLRAAGVDLDRRLSAGYPVEVWSRCVDAAADLVYPTLKREDAHRRLGEEVIRGFVQTALGRALFGLLKLLKPISVIARMEQSFRHGNNFMKTSFTQLSRTSAKLWVSDVHGQPWLNGGIVWEGGRQSGVKNVDVKILETSGEACTYLLTWDE